jgi:hypothetical protein
MRCTAPVGEVRAHRDLHMGKPTSRGGRTTQKWCDGANLDERSDLASRTEPDGNICRADVAFPVFNKTRNTRRPLFHYALRHFRIAENQDDGGRPDLRTYSDYANNVPSKEAIHRMVRADSGVGGLRIRLVVPRWPLKGNAIGRVCLDQDS